MRITILAWAIAAVAMFGCGSSDGDDTTSDDTGDDATGVDASDLPLCTGAPYDLCMDTAGGSDCTDGMECRFFMGHGFTICVPPCDAENPCPPNEDGGAVDCNQMGRCDPGTTNSCMLPP